MAHSADALHYLKCVLHGQTFTDFLDPAMHVEQPCFQMNDLLTDHTEAKVARLNDPGMNRTDRNFVDSLSLHCAEWKGPLLGPRGRDFPVHILAQGVVTTRPVIVQDQAARVRMADRYDAQ